MKHTARLLAVALAFAALTGCHYRLTDRETGAVYYTTETDAQWMFPGQSAVFVDRTGATVMLVRPKIETISKQEYLDGRAQP